MKRLQSKLHLNHVPSIVVVVALAGNIGVARVVVTLRTTAFIYRKYINMVKIGNF